MKANLDRVEAVVEMTATSLRRSFGAYWPTFGDTGAHERNLSLHAAGAFLSAGFAVFGEGHAHGQADLRFDLLAYSPDHQMFVAAEFKHLWSRSTARAMRHDIERLQDFEPVQRVALPSSTQRIGLVAAFTEADDRYQQLLSNDRVGSCLATRDLLAKLPDFIRWQSKHLCNHGRHPDRADRQLHLVYAVFPLRPS